MESNMNRVPYRRVTPPRNQDGHFTKTTSTSYESPEAEATSLLPKIIISGLLLLAVLLISTADSLEPLRAGLQDILSGASTMRELSDIVLDFGRNQFGFDPTPALYEPPPATTIPSLWE